MNGIVNIIGGGPAGAAAALSALAENVRVVVFEKSKFPRNKVCGEFLSPDVLNQLDRLGLASALHALAPAAMRRAALLLGNREKKFLFPDVAWGLSRAVLDQFLLEAAQQRGANVIRETAKEVNRPLVLAWGRRFRSSSQERGTRLFGFKAHFLGPVNDAVELYFFDNCYVGVNPVEEGRTNVCGIGPENVLRRFGFEHDALVRSNTALRERIEPLKRTSEWLSTGPLRFENQFHHKPQQDVYTAGDAFSFMDPFTGSGLLSALATGAAAGRFAARRRPSSEYVLAARKSWIRPIAFAGILRWAVTSGWAEYLAPFVPGRILFHWTRPPT